MIAWLAGIPSEGRPVVMSVSRYRVRQYEIEIGWNLVRWMARWWLKARHHGWGLAQCGRIYDVFRDECFSGVRVMSVRVLDLSTGAK